MKPNTVFGHLALRFATHPENLATEALGFILRTSPAASRAFTKFVRPFLQGDPGSLRFETQQGGLDQSIPDMKCSDDKGIRVIVENKFWAGLTENQPVTYIRELPASVPALVLLVVPEARLQLVWSEVIKRCKADEIPVSDVQKLTTMISAVIGDGHYIVAASWKVLLDTLSSEMPSAGEIDCRNDIAQLQGLCRTMDEEELLPLRGDELTDLDMARRFINFSNLSLDIVNEAGSQGLCDRKGVKETNYLHASGAYIRIGKYTPWVGFDRLAWRSMGVSPIWVIFPRNAQIAEIREKLAGFRTTTPQRCFDLKNGRAAVPIFLRTGVEKQHVVEDAIRQIRELAKALGILAPSNIDSDPTPADHLDEVDQQPWFEDIYDTEEEREAARERFTDNSGWVLVTPAPEKAE